MKTLAETIPTIPGVAEVVISGNKCFGVVDHPGYEDHGNHTPDKGSNIQKLGFADIGLGPFGMKTLAETKTKIGRGNFFRYLDLARSTIGFTTSEYTYWVARNYTKSELYCGLE
eukprot:SAG11_NODE_3706_length_2267_cov_4.928506_2_plen_114_part_00